MRKKILFFSLFAASVAGAQSIPERYLTTDVQHYRFSLGVNDNNDSIQGEAAVTVKFLKPVSGFSLDLTGTGTQGKGMTVRSVEENNKQVRYLHENNLLQIQTAAAANETRTFLIRYSGIPADGLIISKNKWGHRTMFADNWPNRAHNWIPCKDHPSDKATVEFIVTAPDHYQVVANGARKEETALADHMKKTYWSESVVLPVKVMAIGIADFAVSDACYAGQVPVYSWVYSEDREKGFYDYGFACSILPWYEKYVAPYPYEKLANVQSKTIFGGLENASAIFYAESSVRGNGKAEALLAHEIAHQWFGDAATETDWQHIWLSEGFATYMTNMYLESKYGRDTLVVREKQERGQVIAYSRRKTTPVVDTTGRNEPMQLLNANSYQKGGWVLHMLRCELGDAAFQKGVQNYYTAFKGKNASTPDFRKAMESASGKDLQQFFQQWLYTPGQPVLNTRWQYDATGKTLNLHITQNQETLFSFPLDIQLQAAGQVVKRTIAVSKKETTVSIPIAAEPSQVMLDPDVKLLFEESK